MEDISWTILYHCVQKAACPSGSTADSLIASSLLVVSALLFPAAAVVGEHPGRRVVHIAALPGPVGHPEIHHHLSLAGVVFLEDLTVQQTLLGEGSGGG